MGAASGTARGALIWGGRAPLERLKLGATKGAAPSQSSGLCYKSAQLRNDFIEPTLNGWTELVAPIGNHHEST
jgi:hypothetical protein